jgi:preprotein translocase subunit SecB
MNSPLQLNDYFVQELVIRENATFSPTGTERHAGQINCKLEHARSIEPADHFLVTLTVEVTPSPTAPAFDPYQIVLKIQGIISVHQNAQLTPEQIERLTTINAASILFGLARGLVAQATGVARYGKYLLPPINFVEMFERKHPKPEETPDKPSRKRRMISQGVN